MSTALIRQKLHNYLEVADDRKVEAIYTMMETEIEETDVDYTDEFKNELDRRYAEYESGNAKTFTAEESKMRIEQLLKARGK